MQAKLDTQNKLVRVTAAMLMMTAAVGAATPPHTPKMPYVFEQNQGQEVDLKLVDRIEGIGSRFKGKVLGTDSQKVVLSWSGKEVAVPWTGIKQANRIWKTE